MIDRQVPLYQQVYTILKRKMFAGDFRPGQVLSETLLAENLGVSRTPIREALRLLEKDGLVQIQRYEVAVTKPSREEFLNLYLCRAALEQLVAERAALQATTEDIARMASALQSSAEAIQHRDHKRVLESNTNFHDMMVESAQVAPLSQLMGSIRGPILLARRLVLSACEKHERQILAEHQKLLQGIQDHTPEETKKWMAHHMQNDMERGLMQFEASDRIAPESQSQHTDSKPS